MKFIYAIVLLFTIQCHAQVYRLRAKRMTVIYFNHSQKAQWKKADFLIVMNLPKKTIIVYENQTARAKTSYDIYNTTVLPPDTSVHSDTYGEKIVEFSSIDPDGKECNITFSGLNKTMSKYSSRLCIIYDEFGTMIDVDKD